MVVVPVCAFAPAHPAIATVSNPTQVAFKNIAGRSTRHHTGTEAALKLLVSTPVRFDKTIPRWQSAVVLYETPVEAV